MIRLFMIALTLLAFAGCGSSSSDNSANEGQLSIDAVDLSE